MADEEQTLHRQVHPSWVQEGRITSQAFTPTPKDEGLLSVYDGTQMTPEESFTHYTTELKLSAAGSVSVSAAEAGSVGLQWRLDPKPFPQHAVIDFTMLPTEGMSKNQVATAIKAKAGALAERARQRGWTYLRA
jgi:hypothetical protein